MHTTANFENHPSNEPEQQLFPTLAKEPGALWVAGAIWDCVVHKAGILFQKKIKRLAGCVVTTKHAWFRVGEDEFAWRKRLY